jgi:hypothetical protein
MDERTDISTLVREMSHVLTQISSKSVEELSLSVYFGGWGTEFVGVVRKFPWDVFIQGLSRPELANLARLNVCPHVSSPKNPALFLLPQVRQIILEEYLHAFKHILSFECA